MGTVVNDIFKLNSAKKNGYTNSAIRNARRAVCGVAERETTVKAVNVSKIIKGLQKRGYRVIGTSHNKPGTKYKKLWYTQRGLGML